MKIYYVILFLIVLVIGSYFVGFVNGNNNMRDLLEESASKNYYNCKSTPGIPVLFPDNTKGCIHPNTTIEYFYNYIGGEYNE